LIILIILGEEYKLWNIGTRFLNFRNECSLFSARLRV
jgi:hypothetical protein